MARQPSPYYQDPSAGIAQSLATAIFGNPEMAQQQAQSRAEIAAREAQARENEARARLANAQADGVGVQNNASVGLPALMAAMQPRPREAPPETLDGFLSDDYQPAPAETPDAALRRGLPALLASMGQMNGDKVDPRQIVGTLAAFMGGDEMARRGLVAQGQTPEKQFALTPERADEVAEQGYSSELAKAMGVATINNRDDVPVARINADARRDVAITNNRDDIPVAQIGAGARVQTAGIAADARTGQRPIRGGRAVAENLFPGVRVTDNVRDPNSALGRANPGSWHTKGEGAIDVAPIPGMTFNQYIQRYKDAGYTVIEAKNEVGAGRSAHATGDHWHAVLGGGPSGGKAAPKPKMLSPASLKLLDTEITARTAAEGGIAPEALRLVRARAATIFQQTGNPVAAVEQAVAERKRDGAAIKARRAGANQPPVQNARKAPDGNWYVTRGKNPDGTPAYFKVS